MVSTYIITTEDFKERVKLSQNILTNNIKPSIGPTQEMFAVKMLCREFYNEVLEVVAGNETNQAITNMLPFLKDYLVFKTYAHYLTGASVIMTPAGPRVQVDDTSNPATEKQIGDIQAQANNTANFYQDQLWNYLEKNSTSFPTWANSICGCDNRRTFQQNKLSTVSVKTNKVPIRWT